MPIYFTKCAAKKYYELKSWFDMCKPLRMHPSGYIRYNTLLTHAMSSGFMSKLGQILSQSVGAHDEPQQNWDACDTMKKYIMRRVAATLAATVWNKVVQVTEELCASGQFAEALGPLKIAIDLGHLPSRALKAWLMLQGREGVAKDWNGAFKLAMEGARLGCHHCQGVMAWCYRHGHGIRRNTALSLELARESSENGSRYGQIVLAVMYHFGDGSVTYDFTKAFALYRLAAAQNLDVAQNILGHMYYQGVSVVEAQNLDAAQYRQGWIPYHGHIVVRDFTEALRLYQLAAAQGYPQALYKVAECHEHGLGGVPKNKVEAIRWYRRAQAAGNPNAAEDLRRLKA
jgi:TPR repeat protein